MRNKVVWLTQQQTGKQKVLNVNKLRLVDPNIAWDEVNPRPIRNPRKSTKTIGLQDPPLHMGETLNRHTDANQPAPHTTPENNLNAPHTSKETDPAPSPSTSAVATPQGPSKPSADPPATSTATPQKRSRAQKRRRSLDAPDCTSPAAPLKLPTPAPPQKTTSSRVPMLHQHSAASQHLPRTSHGPARPPSKDHRTSHRSTPYALPDPVTPAPSTPTAVPVTSQPAPVPPPVPSPRAPALTRTSQPSKADTKRLHRQAPRRPHTPDIHLSVKRAREFLPRGAKRSCPVPSKAVQKKARVEVISLVQLL